MNPEYANILKYAMQMEKDGAQVFRDSAARFQDGTTAGLFENLAKVEEAHYEYLEDKLAAYTGGTLDGNAEDAMMNQGEQDIFSSRADSEHLDTTLVESDTPDITILRMAYLIEKDFAEFYEEMQDYVEDENLKGLFAQLSEWERGHESLFKSEYKRLMKEYMSLPWGG